jgi:thiamine transport system permease protein
LCAAPILAILCAGGRRRCAAWAVLLEPQTLLALWNTARFTAGALVLATLLGVTHALAARRSTWLRAAAFLPFVVSPVTVALRVAAAVPGMEASLPLLLARLCAAGLSVRRQCAGCGARQPAAVAAAGGAHAGGIAARVFWRVTLPLVLPALRRGMAFAAATALGEFAVTLFLSRPEWSTLTTLIYERLGRPGAANRDEALVLAALLMLLACWCSC